MATRKGLIFPYSLLTPSKFLEPAKINSCCQVQRGFILPYFGDSAIPEIIILTYLLAKGLYRAGQIRYVTFIGVFGVATLGTSSMLDVLRAVAWGEFVFARIQGP